MNKPYTLLFEICVAKLLMLEGGINDDPNDRGGLTNFGISKNAHPDVDIANLTKEQAIDIYWHEYWLVLDCDQYNPALAYVVFDSGVHEGVGRPQQYLEVAKNHYGLFMAAKRKNFKTYAQWEHYKDGWLNRLDSVAEFAAHLDHEYIESLRQEPTRFVIEIHGTASTLFNQLLRLLRILRAQR